MTLFEAIVKTPIQVSQVRIFASISVPFRPTTVQMPNLALFETKRITVQTNSIIACVSYNPDHKTTRQSIFYVPETHIM